MTTGFKWKRTISTQCCDAQATYFAHLFDSQTVQDILRRQGKMTVYAVFLHTCLILTLMFLNIIFFFHLKGYKLEITLSWRNTYPTNFREACNNPACQLKLNSSLSCWWYILYNLRHSHCCLQGIIFSVTAFRHNLLIHCTLKHWADKC